MSWIAATDPLALLAASTGGITAPIEGGSAAGNSPLDTAQKSAVMGDPVPVVFARRLNNAGGILISPAATEARFQNDNTNAVTASYLLVLSEGQMDGIQVRDVFQGPCRVGSFSQTYDRRAGTWTPGNYITQQGAYKLPQCSYYCGSVGAYPGITTLSFQVTVGNENDFWRKQVHCFIRGGMWVTRLEDNTLGPSNSYADLVLWLMQKTSRIPSTLIDSTAMTKADLFLRANGLTCNCELRTSQNLPDLLSNWSRYFLLSESKVLGKRGLRPLLPVNTDGTIKTTAITPVFKFNESLLLLGSLEINYVNLSDRLPFVAQVLWRQEVESDIAIVRTAEVRYSGTAANGPYEQHDLSAFCTSEAHAVKVGAYIVARRQYVTHTCKFTAAPGSHAIAVNLGDIVQLSFNRSAAGYTSNMTSYLYQVERITKADTGDVTYECTHFPVNSNLQSLVALDVTSATPTGILLTSNQSGVSCDLNSKTSTTVPSETYSSPDSSVGGGGVSISGGSFEAVGGDLISLTWDAAGPNEDGLDQFNFTPHGIYPADEPLSNGSGLVPTMCGANQTQSITWYQGAISPANKVATVTLDSSGNVISRVNEPGKKVDGWLDAFAGTPGVLLVNVGNTTDYLSVTKCVDGTTHVNKTTVPAGTTALPDRYQWFRWKYKTYTNLGNYVTNSGFSSWISTANTILAFDMYLGNFSLPVGKYNWPGKVAMEITLPSGAWSGGACSLLYYSKSANTYGNAATISGGGTSPPDRPLEIFYIEVSYEFTKDVGGSPSSTHVGWSGYDQP